MSAPDRNCAFLIFTVLPVFAAATSRSVWRQRNAGIWITSTTSPTGAACHDSWMSVRSFSPHFARTSASIRSPFSSPGPRNDEIEVRLALSNDALKMMSAPSLSLIATRRCATVSSSSADSMTHGPAINLIFIRFDYELRTKAGEAAARQAAGLRLPTFHFPCLIRKASAFSRSSGVSMPMVSASVTPTPIL